MKSSAAEVRQDPVDAEAEAGVEEKPIPERAAESRDEAPKRVKRLEPESGAAPDAEGDDNDEEEEKEDKREAAFGAEVDFNSRFLWRGIAFSQGPVFQPSAWATVYGLTLDLWSSMMLNDELARSQVSAFEPSLVYALTLDRVKLAPGVTVFFTPNEPGPRLTKEATFEASYRLGHFHLLSGTYIDIQSNAGAYFGTFGADYERTAHDWTIRAVVDVGWATRDFNDAYFGVDEGALNLVHAGLSTRYDFYAPFYVSLHAEASVLLQPALRNSVDESMLGSGGAAFGIEY